MLVVNNSYLHHLPLDILEQRMQFYGKLYTQPLYP